MNTPMLVDSACLIALSDLFTEGYKLRGVGAIVGKDPKYVCPKIKIKRIL